jgi:hypothetical protein
LLFLITAYQKTRQVTTDDTFEKESWRSVAVKFLWYSFTAQNQEEINQQMFVISSYQSWQFYTHTSPTQNRAGNKLCNYQSWRHFRTWKNTCEQNEMSLNWRSNMTLFRSRLINSSSLSPTWINIVLFCCSAAAGFCSPHGRCKLKASTSPDFPHRPSSRPVAILSETATDGSCASPGTGSETRDVNAAASPVNVSSEPLLDVLSRPPAAAASSLAVFDFTVLPSSFSSMLTIRSRSPGKLCVLVPLSWRSRRRPTPQTDEEDYIETDTQVHTANVKNIPHLVKSEWKIRHVNDHMINWLLLTRLTLTFTQIDLALLHTIVHIKPSTVSVLATSYVIVTLQKKPQVAQQLPIGS